jgi:hypothetical protein
MTDSQVIWDCVFSCSCTPSHPKAQRCPLLQPIPESYLPTATFRSDRHCISLSFAPRRSGIGVSVRRHRRIPALAIRAAGGCCAYPGRFPLVPLGGRVLEESGGRHELRVEVEYRCR